MAKKFHVNMMGNAGECSAEQGNCPFAKDDEHFATAQEAQTAFEETMRDKIFGESHKASNFLSPKPEDTLKELERKLTSANALAFNESTPEDFMRNANNVLELEAEINKRRNNVYVPYNPTGTQILGEAGEQIIYQQYRKVAAAAKQLEPAMPSPSHLNVAGRQLGPAHAVMPMLTNLTWDRPADAVRDERSV